MIRKRAAFLLAAVVLVLGHVASAQSVAPSTFMVRPPAPGTAFESQACRDRCNRIYEACLRLTGDQSQCGTDLAYCFIDCQQ